MGIFLFHIRLAQMLEHLKVSPLCRDMYTSQVSTHIKLVTSSLSRALAVPTL